MKNSIRYILSVLFLALLTLEVDSQNEKDSVPDYEISTTFQSRYVWRGLDLGGPSPSLQPAMSISWKGFSLGCWGALSFAKESNQEVDLYLSYTFFKELFSVIISDYFAAPYNDFSYFNYRNNTTLHVFEAGFSYNGFEKVPVKASLYINFFGADAKNSEGRNLFSSYAEIAYCPVIKRIGVELNLFAGAALNGQYYIDFDLGQRVLGFYGNKGFAVVNVGLSATKELVIKDKLAIPISTALIVNPNARQVFLVGSIGFIL